MLGWVGIGGYLLVQGAISIPVLWGFLVSYLFSMFLLSPDLDLARSRAFRRWGILRFLWLPYARIFRHRGMSHRLILGPASRVVYLTAIAGAIGLVLSLLGVRLAPEIPSWRILLAIGIGLYLPNLTHILTDRIDSLRRG